MRIGSVAILLTLGVGCGGGAPGSITAEGTWADGATIRFSAELGALRSGGRVSLATSSNSGADRFAGIRITYDPAKLTAPGRYAVDPGAEGWLELYCRRMTEPASGASRELVEYEASTATITFTAVPSGGARQIEGTFEGVSVSRSGQLLLRLGSGAFSARLP